MSVLHLPRHAGLFETTRLRRLATEETSARARDWLILVLAGFAAACASTFLDLQIKRVPGHAILRVVLPMALGLAIVPRRGAGCVMGLTALSAGMAFRFAGFKGESLGFGALTSLTATGPLLDWTLRRAQGGWRQYVSFGMAGLVSNLFALGVRGGAKAMGWERAGGRPLAEWLAQGVVTYVLCGLAAGLISGMILFRRREAVSQSGSSSSSLDSL